MTIQQLAKQLQISPKVLEKESLRAFLLTKLGEIEAHRQKITRKYEVENAMDWDEKLREGTKKEGEYKELTDYFQLDTLDEQKEQLLSLILSRT